MEDSYITVRNKGKESTITSYVGSDATHLFQARTLIIMLKYIQKGFRLTSEGSPTKLLKLASSFTGKKYKRGQYDEAITDVQIWVNTMECALPIIVEESNV